MSQVLIPKIPATGRLTLASGDPTPILNQGAKSTLYYTPCAGNQIGLYTGTGWIINNFNQTSLSLSGLTSGSLYDVFGYDNTGTLGLELGNAWTNSSTRSQLLDIKDGIYIMSGTTRRYLGTIRTSSSTTTEDTDYRRLVFNHENKSTRSIFVQEATSHTYNSSVPRNWLNNNNTVLEFVQGIGGLGVSFSSAVTNYVTAGGIGYVEMATNFAVWSGSQNFIANTFTGTWWQPSMTCTGVTGNGYNYIKIQEYVTSGTVTNLKINLHGMIEG